MTHDFDRWPVPADWASGRAVRKGWNCGVSRWQLWRRWSVPAFYGRMARLAAAGLVEERVFETERYDPGRMAVVVAKRHEFRRAHDRPGPDQPGHG